VYTEAADMESYLLDLAEAVGRGDVQGVAVAAVWADSERPRWRVMGASRRVSARLLNVVEALRGRLMRYIAAID